MRSSLRLLVPTGEARRISRVYSACKADQHAGDAESFERRKRATGGRKRCRGALTHTFQEAGESEADKERSREQGEYSNSNEGRSQNTGSRKLFDRWQQMTSTTSSDGGLRGGKEGGREKGKRKGKFPPNRNQS